MELDRALDEGDAEVELALVGERQTCPEQQLRVVRGQLQRAPAGDAGLLVTALGAEPLGLVHQVVRLAHVEEARELLEGLGMVLDTQLDGTPPRLPLARDDEERRRLAAAPRARRRPPPPRAPSSVAGRAAHPRA